MLLPANSFRVHFKALKPLIPAGKSKVTTLIMLVILLGGLSAGVRERQALFDAWRLRNYQAPAAIAALATQDTMTDYTRHVYYVNHPTLQEKVAFRISCPNNGGEQTIVLGCYHGNQDGISLLSVTDSRLNGVEQVTAAHEALHAIYDRLSSSKRAKVDAMLTDYYIHDVHDQRIIDTINAYKKTEPNDVVNEMHSVFGTEIAALPTGLEQYYQQYFTNRQQVVSFAAQYEAEFTSRDAAVKQDDAQLATLKTQIDSEESDLKAKQATIASQQQTLEQERSSNAAAYNAAVPGYNDSIDAYNTEIESVRSLITQYNQLVETRNALAVEESSLANALNANDTQPINK